MFQDQYEYDLLGDGPRLLDTEAGITDSLSKLLQEKADEEALENGITDDEEEGEDACCEGDDAFDDVEGTFDDEDVGHPAPPVLNEEEEEVEVLEDDVLEEGDTVDIDDDDVQQGGAASEPEKELDQKKKKKKSSKKSESSIYWPTPAGIVQAPGTERAISRGIQAASEATEEAAGHPTIFASSAEANKLGGVDAEFFFEWVHRGPEVHICIFG